VFVFVIVLGRLLSTIAGEASSTQTFVTPLLLSEKVCKRDDELHEFIWSGLEQTLSFWLDCFVVHHCQ